jgi:hypothetical protein
MADEDDDARGDDAAADDEDAAGAAAGVVDEDPELQAAAPTARLAAMPDMASSRTFFMVSPCFVLVLAGISVPG